MKLLRIFKNVFKLHSTKESLVYAIRGIGYLFLFHRNMRIIFLSGIAAFLLGIYLKIETYELLILCVTISMVFIAEMFNTAIELIIDMFTENYHVLLKIIKDISAGVVLIAALNSLVVGYFIFLRRIFSIIAN